MLKRICMVFVLLFYLFGQNQVIGSDLNYEILDVNEVNEVYYIEKSPLFEKIEKPCVAIALGGGGARALVNIGVLKALEEENIPIDILVGTSMGAIVAVLYGSGLSVGDIEQIALADILPSLFNLNFPFVKSLINTKGLNYFLEKVSPNNELESFVTPTAILSYDLKRGVKYVHTTGRIAKTIQNSYALPFLFPVQNDEDFYLIDPGYVELTPALTAQLLGADMVISTTAFEKTTNSSFNLPLLSWVKLLSLMKENNARRIVERYSDVIIEHDVSAFSFTDFPRAKELIQLGYTQTKAQMPMIKKILQEKQIPLVLELHKRERENLYVLEDMQNGREVLGYIMSTPLFYFGKDHSLFSPELFANDLLEPQYGLRFEVINLVSDILTQGFKGDNYEIGLRIKKFSPHDLIWKMESVQGQRNYQIDLVGYFNQYRYAIGWASLNTKKFFHFKEMYSVDFSQIRITGIIDLYQPIVKKWGLTQCQYQLMQKIEIPILDSWSWRTKLVFCSDQLPHQPNIYRGVEGISSPLQAAFELAYVKKFSRPVNVIPMLQWNGFQEYQFVDLQSEKTAFGIGGNLDLRILGMRPLEFGGYASYDWMEKVIKTQIILDFTF